MFFYVKYKKIEVFCIFFEKNFVVSQILFTFAPEMPAHVRVGTLKLTSMERDLRPFVRPVSKGVFERYCLLDRISQI